MCDFKLLHFFDFCVKCDFTYSTLYFFCKMTNISGICVIGTVPDGLLFCSVSRLYMIT